MSVYLVSIIPINNSVLSANQIVKKVRVKMIIFLLIVVHVKIH